MPSRDASVAAIFDHFDALSDPRLERNKLHLLHEMVVIALCAAICGADGWADVERFGKTRQKGQALLALPPGLLAFLSMPQMLLTKHVPT